MYKYNDISWNFILQLSGNYLLSILKSENPMQSSRKIVSVQCGRKKASLKPLILTIRFFRA